jgi:hypothetical protein
LDRAVFAGGRSQQVLGARGNDLQGGENSVQRPALEDRFNVQLGRFFGSYRVHGFNPSILCIN